MHSNDKANRRCAMKPWSLKPTLLNFGKNIGIINTGNKLVVAMKNRFLFDKGGHLQLMDSGKAPVFTQFPVCLAIKNGNDLVATCADFVLNIEKAWVFIRTGTPLPAGTSLLMHFYSPPETKLLAEIRGKVVPEDAAGMQLQHGMLIRFAWLSQWKLKRLVRYAKGELHLVDKAA
jgi:hypothetical protein